VDNPLISSVLIRERTDCPGIIKLSLSSQLTCCAGVSSVITFQLCRRTKHCRPHGNDSDVLPKCLCAVSSLVPSSCDLAGPAFSQSGLNFQKVLVIFLDFQILMTAHLLCCINFDLRARC
jgi:hypothetical protein